MSDEKLSFWAELKRRRVYRTAGLYAATAFVVWQVADIVIPSLGLPEWTMKAIVILSAIGFIPALVLSWAFDLRSASAGASPSRSRLVLVALAVVAFGTTGWWATTKIKTAPPNLSDVSLAVFPFSVRMGNLSYLKEGLVDLLSRNLTGTGQLQPLDPSLMLKVTKGEAADAQTAAAIARQVGAGRFVLGNVSGAGARVRIDATLYAVRDSLETVTTRMVEGDTTQLFALVDQLTAALLSELSEGAVSERTVKAAASTTRSLPALKAYLQGEQAYRRGRHPAAIGAFQEAITTDSTFVLARYRLALSYQMNQQYWLARKSLLDVAARQELLLPHDQRVLNALVAWHNGSVAQAERELDQIVTEFPRDLEARVLLADLLLLYARHRAESKVYAVELLQSVLHADPKFVCILCHLGEVTAQIGQFDEAERLFLRLEKQNGNDSTKLGPVLATNLALKRGDTATARAQLPRFAERYRDATTYDVWLTGAAHASTARGYFAFTDAVLALPEFGRGRPDLRAIVTAQLHGARGQHRLAQQVIANTVQRKDPVDDQGGAYSVVTSTPFEQPLPMPDQLREIVARVTPDTTAVPVNELARSERGIRLFMLGLIASRNGDAPSAIGYADSLAALEKNPLDAGNVRNARMVLLADRALRENKPADAAARLESMSLELRPGQLRAWHHMMEYAGALRVRAYVSLKRNTDALRWLTHHTNYFSAVSPPQSFGQYSRDMANVLDQLGRRDEAIKHYAAFVNAWQHADPELQPAVAAARQRLKELLPKQ